MAGRTLAQIIDIYVLHELLGHGEIRLHLKKLHTYCHRPEVLEEKGQFRDGGDLEYLPKEASEGADTLRAVALKGRWKFCPPPLTFVSLETSLIVTIRAGDRCYWLLVGRSHGCC